MASTQKNTLACNQLRADEIVGRFGGTLLGKSDQIVSNALPLRDATSDCITLVDSEKRVLEFLQSPATIALAEKSFQVADKTLIITTDLHGMFQQLIEFFRPASKLKSTGVHIQAVVAANAEVGEGTSIGPNVTIGDGCRIGARCTLHPGVTIMDDCNIGDDCEIFPDVTIYPQTRVGSRVLIHAGTVLGAYGFGYRQVNGCHVRSGQLGWVEIEDDVEIGTQCSVDRGTYGSTRIGAGSKLDNQVQIGHNCQIGKHNLICAQVGIAGSSSTGDYVVLAGQVGIADHIHIAEGAIVAAQSGIMENLSPKQTYLGSPAVPIKQKMMEIAASSRLPEMRKTLRNLEKRLLSVEESTIKGLPGARADAA
ncbi:MAG: UDP-3-O-(3-hydroxymyristoyl)glucosamine N-acyltransferase [Planctomycetales bacterium]|nr:UDP-3-O-(3-hydroxymyristoyl)glucosamine N-acyltransferase [Planctomycetales bacterium]